MKFSQERSESLARSSRGTKRGGGGGGCVCVCGGGGGGGEEDILTI